MKWDEMLLSINSCQWLWHTECDIYRVHNGCDIMWHHGVGAHYYCWPTSRKAIIEILTNDHKLLDIAELLIIVLYGSRMGKLFTWSRVSTEHSNSFSATFQDHVFKCYFGKTANLKSITTNNCHVTTCSTQLQRHTVILLTTALRKLLLKYIL